MLQPGGSYFSWTVKFQRGAPDLSRFQIIIAKVFNTAIQLRAHSIACTTPITDTYIFAQAIKHVPHAVVFYNMTSTPNGNEAESRAAQLDSEIELLIASILPSESLTSSPEGAWPRQLLITSSDSRFSLHIAVGEEYPDKAAVNVQIKADDLGRDEAEGWKEWVEGIMREWDDQSE